uniref:Large ribosomal subunit protein uL16c n=1 Tax=Tydemania expeditionis TaxID=325645 RepID=A0A0D6E255_TYDEX|nr:50S ribosomal protein L16 [Tydemania expeditionis]CEO91123.1 50S ribosomal protein L16 [Tydemania expeditionis]
MLQPKRTKFRKTHRGRLKGNKFSKTAKTLLFGDFALQALEPCWLTGRQIEAGRRVISRITRRGGKIWIHPFPDKPVTFRPAETRMGSGKGAPEYWVAVVKPGQILYEIKNVPALMAREALKNASSKIPIKTKIIVNQKGILL